MNDSRNDDTPRIPGYDISRRLGRGGMADVYLALQSSLSRPVAIKVLAAERTQGEETVTRFEQEARTIARLDHPNIVSIFDVGRTGDGRLYYVMPYLPNGDLSTRDLRENESAIVDILRALLHALGYAHKLGVVHRDVKPENVLFDKLDRPLLADFGIALASADFARVTREGSTIGSSGYMSPEQSRGFAIDGRSDLYSLGVVAYEMLSGELPYKGPDTLAVALAHVEQPIPRLPPRRRRWQAFIDKAMAKSPDERFQSAEQMEAALEALDPQAAMTRETGYETKPLPALAERPRTRLPATVLAATLLTLAGAAMIVYALRDLRSAPARIGRAPEAPLDVAPSTGAAAPGAAASANAPDAPAPASSAAAGSAPAATPPERPADAPAATPANPGEAMPSAAKPGETGERKDADKETSPRVRLASLAAGAVLRDRGGPTLVFVPDKGARDGKGGGFALARYETTRRDYAAFVEATGRAAAKCREPHSPLSAFRKYSWREPGFEQEDSHPVVCVSWADANAYAQWLGTRTHAHYRLPTHAEWLQAMRAAPEKTDACAQGNLADDKRAVLRSNEDGCSDGFAHTAPVGKFKPNRLGIYDLVGNASEWTLDCKGGDAKSDDGAACPQRMFSGRSWRDDADGGVDGEDDAGADIGYTTIGFRLLRELGDDDVPPLVK